MKPIINPWLFYLVDVIDSFRFTIFLLLILFTLILGIQAIIENNNEDDEVKVEDVIKDSVDYIFEKINTNNKGE